MMTRENIEDVDVLARTLFGEAESGNLDDAESIAAVVVNRVHYPNWPDRVSRVCLQPWQFSCWNHNDPNRDRILNASGRWFEQCRAVAERAVQGALRDRTSGATHYYATYVPEPKWARNKKPVHRVNHRNGHAHIFFNDIDTPPPKSAADALAADRPLASTRTMTGVGVAAAATAVQPVIDILERVSVQAGVVQKFISISPWILSALALVFLAYIAWARFDDRRRGLR